MCRYYLVCYYYYRHQNHLHESTQFLSKNLKMVMINLRF
ncbi:unnamed protein product [Schistosoma curassoni]|uniref:Uncharacterized protein n=1 Tax=Schistosoma curassoni TaxID=6186 RepID=A0A183KAJ4_9TREM|nr:unnamed protein product [Schistosoma curassoni]